MSKSILLVGFEISDLVIDFAKKRAESLNVSFLDVMTGQFLRLLREENDEHIIKMIKRIEIAKSKKDNINKENREIFFNDVKT